MVLEIDEYDGHHQSMPFAEDRAKDRYAASRGYLPLRATDTELKIKAKEVANTLKQALADRAPA